MPALHCFVHECRRYLSADWLTKPGEEQAVCVLRELQRRHEKWKQQQQTDAEQVENELHELRRQKLSYPIFVSKHLLQKPTWGGH